MPLLRHLLLASAEHRELAAQLQQTIQGLRMDLSAGLDEAWRDRSQILEEVVESGGTGLGGDVAAAKEATRPVIKEWKGLGFLLPPKPVIANGHDHESA